MDHHHESQDAAIAQALAEEEITLATASNIELARRLAERPAIVYQEIAFEQGQQNIAQARAQQAAMDAAQEPASVTQLPHCLICDRAGRLSEIESVGHLCFSCLQHNSGAELEGLAFG
jgi:hypothetical protein